jgi:hypothetical protein
LNAPTETVSSSEVHHVSSNPESLLMAARSALRQSICPGCNRSGYRNETDCDTCRERTALCQQLLSLTPPDETKEPQFAGPTWTCFECRAVDEFSVQHEELAQEGNRVVTMIECNACGFKCTDARSETRPGEKAEAPQVLYVRPQELHGHTPRCDETCVPVIRAQKTEGPQS